MYFLNFLIMFLLLTTNELIQPSRIHVCTWIGGSCINEGLTESHAIIRNLFWVTKGRLVMFVKGSTILGWSKPNKTGVISDPQGQIHRHASSEHCFLSFCFSRFEKWGRTDVRTTCAKTIIPTGRVDKKIISLTKIVTYQSLFRYRDLVCFCFQDQLTHGWKEGRTVRHVWNLWSTTDRVWWIKLKVLTMCNQKRIVIDRTGWDGMGGH